MRCKGITIRSSPDLKLSLYYLIRSLSGAKGPVDWLLAVDLKCCYNRLGGLFYFAVGG